MGVTDAPRASQVAEAVMRIRHRKLPNPAVLGNAGSFFKNPVIDKKLYDNLVSEYPDMPNYPVNAETVKVPAGWLIEKSGWKGKVVGNCGVHKNQALVLINYGNASGKEVFELSENIIQAIQTKFGIVLEREVNIV